MDQNTPTTNPRRVSLAFQRRHLMAVPTMPSERFAHKTVSPISEFLWSMARVVSLREAAKIQ